MKSTVARDSGYQRRRYHKEFDGGKNEWKSLIRHYEEHALKADLLEKIAKRACHQQIS